MKTWKCAYLSYGYLFLAAEIAGGVSPALADDTSDQNVAGSTQLGEIVVTAQRRAERLQDVPISVAAISGTDLATQHLNSTLDLSAVVPGLNVSMVGSSGIIYIRGVGQNDGSPNAESAVATYVDGVYIASSIANIPRFNNIDRIEVLKGPQGTLFGRNATAGVIQVITRDPSETPAAEISGGYGNYGTSTASLYLTGGVAPGVAADLSVLYDNQDEGYGTNLLDGSSAHINAINNIGLRSKLLIDVGDATQIRIAADYGRNRSTEGEYTLAAGSRGFDGQFHPVGGPYNVDLNLSPSNEIKQYGASVHVDHDFSAARFESISAYRNTKGVLVGDFDSTPLPISNYTLQEEGINFSQEFHLLSARESAVDWMLGAFYFNSKSGYIPQTVTGLAVAPLPSVELFSTQKVESASLFGQATFTILPKTKLTLGLRGTTERVRLVDASTQTPGAILASYPDQHISTGRVTWRIALDHQFTNDVLGYISYNRGLKSGGFSILTPSAPGFKPEVLDAYETGLKSEWLERRLLVNFAAFIYKDKNLQVNQLSDQYGTVTQNAGAATIKGVDLEIKAIPLTGLTLSTTMGYLKSKFDKYDNALGYGPNASEEFLTNATGNELINAPKFTGSATMEYSVDSSVGTFKPSVTGIRNSGYFVSADNRLRQPSYTRLNASLGWTSMNQRFGASLWGANLTNALYYVYHEESVVGDLVEPAAPRTYGVAVNVKF